MVDPVRVHARGHDNVTARHGSTFELTADDWLTSAGDCILAVEADLVPAGFPEPFAEACRSRDATVAVELRAGGHAQTVTAGGDERLTFDSEHSAVVRTSDYVDDRTVAVGADAAAADLDRDLVAALAAGADLTATFRVEETAP